MTRSKVRKINEDLQTTRKSRRSRKLSETDINDGKSSRRQKQQRDRRHKEKIHVEKRLTARQQRRQDIKVGFGRRQKYHLNQPQSSRNNH